MNPESRVRVPTISSCLSLEHGVMKPGIGTWNLLGFGCGVQLRALGANVIIVDLVNSHTITDVDVAYVRFQKSKESSV